MRQSSKKYLMTFTLHKVGVDQLIIRFQDNGHLTDMRFSLLQVNTIALKLKLASILKFLDLEDSQMRFKLMILEHLMDLVVKILVLFKISGDLSKTFILSQRVES